MSNKANQDMAEDLLTLLETFLDRFDQRVKENEDISMSPTEYAHLMTSIAMLNGVNDALDKLYHEAHDEENDQNHGHIINIDIDEDL